MPTVRWILGLLGCWLACAGSARSQACVAAAAEARGTDHYGDWMMWWSTNREEFLCRTDPAAESRPTEAEKVRLVTDQDRREKIIPVLTRALKDGEKQIREAASIALGTCGDGRDVDALVSLLGDKDRAVVEAAVLGLGLLSAPEAEIALGRLVADATTYERKRGLAALALGLSGGEAARSPLFDGLGSDKSEKFEGCRMIGACLWSGGDLDAQRPHRAAQASSAVLKAVRGQEKRRKLVSFGAAALSKSRDPASKASVLAMLKDSRFDLRASAALAAGRVLRQDDQDGVRALIKALAAEPHTLPTRFMIISLGRIGGPEPIVAITKEYASGDKTRRAFAALALGIAGARDHAPKIRTELMGTTEDRLKGAFAVTLGLFDDPEAFASVSQICQGRVNDELLSHCVWFFALSQNRGSAQALERILGQSRVPGTQEAAATALGAIGAVGSIPYLAGMLQEKGTESARKAAATGLGRMRDQRGVEALLRAAADEKSPAVRAAAIAALGAVARRTNLWPVARVAIDAYFAIVNEPVDDTTARVGSILRETECGGAPTSPK